MAIKRRPWARCLALTLVLIPFRLQAEARSSPLSQALLKPNGNFSQSRSAYHSAQPASLALAENLNELGVEALNCGHLRSARRYLLQALRIRQKVAPNSLLVAESLNRLGRVAQNRDDLVRAEDYYSDALRIRQKLAPESLIQSETLESLGNTSYQRGALPKAEAYLLQALAIRQELAPRSRDLAMTLVEVGSLWGRRGDATRQEDCFQQTLLIGEKLAPIDNAAILDALGSAVGESAHPAKAKQYFEKALQIQQEVAPDSISSPSV